MGGPVAGAVTLHEAGRGMTNELARPATGTTCCWFRLLLSAYMSGGGRRAYECRIHETFVPFAVRAAMFVLPQVGDVLVTTGTQREVGVQVLEVSGWPDLQATDGLSSLVILASCVFECTLFQELPVGTWPGSWQFVPRDSLWRTRGGILAGMQSGDLHVLGPMPWRREGRKGNGKPGNCQLPGGVRGVWDRTVR